MKKLLKSRFIPPQPGLAPGEIVLRELREGKEWATHFHNLQDSGYYHGHYFTSLAEAEADYEKRLREELGEEAENSDRRVKVPPHIFEALTAIRDVGTTNMFDVEVVKVQAVALDFPETADWIEANKQTYVDGIFRGFEPEQND